MVEANNKRDIVIIANFCGDLSNKNNGRFAYLANMLKDFGSVEIITSNFIHYYKSHRINEKNKLAFKTTFIREPGYDKNICLKRFYSHFVWGLNIFKYLRKRKKPDIVYCAVPSLTGPYLVARYCEKNGIKFIVDIQDLWPEAFKMVFNVPILSDIAYQPFNFLANGIYKRADEIVAVSQTYVERALKVNNRVKEGHSVFLGTELSDFDAYAKNNLLFDNKLQNKVTIKKENELWLAYCGTLGASYDLISVFDALEIIKNKGIKPPKFIVMGDGPQYKEFVKYAENKKLDVVFTDSLPYQQMCYLLCKCDIAVNPIISRSAASIINKHSDYVASGHPVINTQESSEYRNLVDEYKMGFNCKNGNAMDIANKMQKLIESPELRKEMGKNARRCAEERFDREFTYKEIVNCILKQGSMS